MTEPFGDERKKREQKSASTKRLLAFMLSRSFVCVSPLGNLSFKAFGMFFIVKTQTKGLKMFEKSLI